MDYGALMPEINSARMYAGPGSGPMLAASVAWAGLAAELHSAAASYGSVISGLTTGPWRGPSSMAMAAAAAPYVAWMSATAGQAELAATQAQAAAGAFEAAFAMTVPPPLIAANRAQLMMLVATNFFGQNTPAIATTEAHYGEMWAQDAAAMYGYAANSAATNAKVTPFTAAPQTTNPAGLAAQAAQGAGTSTGTGVQSTLSQLVSTVPTALQSLASPMSATSSTSGLSGILSGLLGGSSGASTTGVLGSSTASSFLQSVALDGIDLAGFFGIFMAIDPIGAVMTTPIVSALSATAVAPVDAAAGAADAAGAAAAEGALGSGFAGDFGGLAGLGQAVSAGGLSVPPSWGWAATGPAAMLGGVPLAVPDTGFGAGLGAPMMLGGLPRAGAAGAGGTNAAKYGLPLAAVMTRPPAAGYLPAPASPPTRAFPVPAGLPPSPGYTPAIVYLPINGHAPAEV